MSCSTDVRDYFLGELPEAERLAAERHFKSCGACASELERLHMTRASLMMLADEEPPQRIAFVSDKVFEPSPVKRWLAAFWNSGARLGFASAAMLSVALLVHAGRQPAVRIVEKPVPVAAASAPVNVDAIIREAVAQAEAREEQKTRALLKASEERHQIDNRALMIRMEETFTVLQKKYTNVLRASAMTSDEDGARR